MAFYVRHRDEDRHEEAYDTAFDAVFAAGQEVGENVADHARGGYWNGQDRVIEVLVGDEENREVIFSHEYRA